MFGSSSCCASCPVLFRTRSGVPRGSGGGGTSRRDGGDLEILALQPTGPMHVHCPRPGPAWAQDRCIRPHGLAREAYAPILGPEWARSGAVDM
eukprot:8952428-Pyramimonas_sp.AAC.1